MGGVIVVFVSGGLLNVDFFVDESMKEGAGYVFLDELEIIVGGDGEGKE